MFTGVDVQSALCINLATFYETMPATVDDVNANNAFQGIVSFLLQSFQLTEDVADVTKVAKASAIIRSHMLFLRNFLKLATEAVTSYLSYLSVQHQLNKLEKLVDHLWEQAGRPNAPTQVVG